MSGYKHRVSIEELATPLYPVRRISAAIPVVVGTAPVLDPSGPVEKPELIYWWPVQRFLKPMTRQL